MAARIIAALIFLISVQRANAACGPDAAPAYAQAYGLTCETFHDGPFSTTTIDVSNTATFANPNGSCSAPPCKWYTDAYFPNMTPTPPGCPGGPACSPTPSSTYSISSGVITLNRQSAYAASRVDLATCKGNGMSVGQYVGNVFSAPFYIEILPTNYGTGLDSATAEATFWLLTIQYLTAGLGAGSDGEEIDALEGNGPNRDFHHYTVDAAGTQKEWFQNMTSTPIAGHTNGTLVLPQNRDPNNDGYNTGLSIIYDNGSEVAGNRITWGTQKQPTYNGGNYNTSGSNPGGLPQDTGIGSLSSANTNQWCLLMGSGFNIPLSLQYVRVWQLPAAATTGARKLWTADDMPRFVDVRK